MQELLRCENLTHVYSIKTPFEFRALDNINLSIEKNSFVGLIGHTGSGKSTFIQHLNGLLKPTSGKIFLDGTDIWAEPRNIRSVRFRVGLVFQFPEYQLFEDTVKKDIAFGPTNMGLDKAEVESRVSEAAELVGLDGRMLSKTPFELSGGERRRVAIAGVLAMKPELLVLDEPTAGLDPRGRDELLGYISDYREQDGHTVIIVSHSMDDVARVADRVVVLSKGSVMLDGTPSKVFSHEPELREAGLTVPAATRVMRRLKAMGLPVDDGVYKLDDAVSELMRCRNA